MQEFLPSELVIVSSQLPAASDLILWPESTVLFRKKIVWAPESSWTLWRVERFSSLLIRPMVPRSSILHCILTQQRLKHYIIKSVSLVINQDSSPPFQVLTQNPSSSPRRTKTDTEMQRVLGRGVVGAYINNTYIQIARVVSGFVGYQITSSFANYG